jgi:hypothetical protein
LQFEQTISDREKEIGKQKLIFSFHFSFLN